MEQVQSSGGLFGFFKKASKPTEPLSAESLRSWLVRRLAKQMSVDPSEIDPTRSFASYGLDSMVAVQVSGDLEKLVEQRLSPALLFEHPSIEELTQHLAAELRLPETA